MYVTRYNVCSYNAFNSYNGSNCYNIRVAFTAWIHSYLVIVLLASVL